MHAISLNVWLENLNDYEWIFSLKNCYRAENGFCKIRKLRVANNRLHSRSIRKVSPAGDYLLERQILTKEEAGGRSTSDRLQLPKWPI